MGDEEQGDSAFERAVSGELPRLGALNRLLPMTVATLLWCGLTGVSAVFVIGSLASQLDAKRRFRTTEGAVLSATIKTHSDGDETTYEPVIEYRYYVHGTAYTSKRYAFDMVSTSDRDYAASIVEKYPKGRRITVYYDPDNPAESVLHLEVPSIQYFLLLFLQPFLVFALFLIAFTGTLPGRLRRAREFLAEPMEVPCHIPTWGDLRHEMGGVAIQGGSGAVGALSVAALGYGLTCFVSIFVFAFLVGLSRADPSKLAAAFIIAVVVAVVAGVLTITRSAGKARLHIDTTLGRLSLRSRRREAELALSRIRAWRVRLIPRVGPPDRKVPAPIAPLLAVLTTGGEEVPIHLFKADKLGKLIADKVARGFAELTARSVEIMEAPVESVQSEPKNLRDGVALTVRAIKEYREFADLT